jgi:hypothetical protein
VFLGMRFGRFRKYFLPFFFFIKLQEIQGKLTRDTRISELSSFNVVNYFKFSKFGLLCFFVT